MNDDVEVVEHYFPVRMNKTITCEYDSNVLYIEKGSILINSNNSINANVDSITMNQINDHDRKM